MLTIEYGTPSGMHTAWLETMKKHRELYPPTFWVAGHETPELLDLRFCLGVSLVILELRGVGANKGNRMFQALQGTGAKAVFLTDLANDLRLWKGGDVVRIDASAQHVKTPEVDEYLEGWDG